MDLRHRAPNWTLLRSRLLGVVIIPVLLAGAAYLAYLSGVYFLKIVLLQYGQFANIRWMPEALGPSSPWLSFEDAWGIDIDVVGPQETTHQYDETEITYYVSVKSRDPVVVHFDIGDGRSSQCGTSDWRSSNHLPPRARVQGTDFHLYWLSWRSREEYVFCLPPGLRYLAENDLINRRVTQLYQQPGFLDPLYAAWVSATITACCAFLLMAGILRLGLISVRLSSRDRLHVCLPITLAACILCVVPKLTIIPWFLIYGGSYRDPGIYGWGAIRTVNGMTWEFSQVAWFTCVYVVFTLLALFSMAGGLRFVANRHRELKGWSDRFARTALWSVPVAVAAWFVLSILICEPIVPGHLPSALDPYQHLYEYPW